MIDFLIEELYDLIKGNISGINTKIFCPISGGLDSRVGAAILSKEKPIDLSYTHFIVGDDVRYVGYAAQIAERLNVKKYYVIPVFKDEIEIKSLELKIDDKNSLAGWIAYEKLAKIEKLKDYTIVVLDCMGWMSGNHVTPFDFIFPRYKKIDRYFRYDYTPRNRNGRDQIAENIFTKMVTTDNDEVMNFWLSLPLRYRVNQYLYRQMIIRKLPEIADIKRADKHFKININEFSYTYKRLLYSLNKIFK